jgi:transposase
VPQGVTVVQGVQHSNPSRPAMVPRVPDELWAKLRPIIDQHDPQTLGRKRIDPRAALDAIIYQMVTGCAWNRLPDTFPDDSSVHRTYQRWQRLGVLNQLLKVIVEESQAHNRLKAS